MEDIKNTNYHYNHINAVMRKRKFDEFTFTEFRGISFVLKLADLDSLLLQGQ